MNIRTKAVTVINHGEGISLCLPAIPNVPAIHNAEILLSEKREAETWIRKRKLKYISLLVLETEIFF
jgi:hypothetical protein